MKKIVIGLVGSGKTTLYRKLNESGQCYAVEMEFPPSFRNNFESEKEKIFKIFLSCKGVDCIISHPMYLPKNFEKFLKKDVVIEFLDIDLQERKSRIKKRSMQTFNGENNCIIFDESFLSQEEELLKKIKQQVLKNGR
ncbi:MAG: hypothetical protein RR140_01250 [Clostridia bacterium]